MLFSLTPCPFRLKIDEVEQVRELSAKDHKEARRKPPCSLREFVDQEELMELDLVRQIDIDHGPEVGLR